MICYHNAIFPSSPQAHRSVSAGLLRRGSPGLPATRGPAARGTAGGTSTPPAPPQPHASVPWLQAAEGDNEVIFLRRAHLGDSPVHGPANQAGRQARERAGWRARRERGRGEAGARRGRGGGAGRAGSCCQLGGVTAVGAPGSQPAATASSPAQAGHSHADGEKKTGGRRAKPAWPPGGGQWPELRLRPPGSKSCSAAPRKAPGVTVAPSPEKPSLASPLAPPASGKVWTFPSTLCLCRRSLVVQPRGD